jgi:flagellar basal-body rod protein FlgF
MQKLPITRQRPHVSRAEIANHQGAQQDLASAFVTFTRAAASLEKSYAQLQEEVSRLHQELRIANSELDLSLQENAQVRGYLSDVLENLPCGVVVANSRKEVQFVNPEAKRLLNISDLGKKSCGLPTAHSIHELFGESSTSNSVFSEQEVSIPGRLPNRTIGIQRKNISCSGSHTGDTIWIVRDLTEQMRLAKEREAAKRSAALADVATVLAHEIRNPLGSMELFTGLLADATSHMPETRQWLTHLQAGLRTLATTANNLANVNTVGFKSQHEFYRSLTAWLQPSRSTQLNDVVNNFGVLGGARIDLSPSTIEPTGNPTDLALEGGGFFTVQTSKGLRYTRAGNFNLDSQRRLVTSQGDAVLGESGPIQVPSGQFTVSPNGTVSVDGALVSKLKISDFPAGSALMPEGSTYFAAPLNSAPSVSSPSIRQGSLENSNSDPIRAAVALIGVQRTAQLMEKALSIFHNEFNRTAATQLSQV